MSDGFSYIKDDTENAPSCIIDVSAPLFVKNPIKTEAGFSVENQQS
jgi:hypothetical protein